MPCCATSLASCCTARRRDGQLSETGRVDWGALKRLKPIGLAVAERHDRRALFVVATEAGKTRGRAERQIWEADVTTGAPRVKVDTRKVPQDKPWVVAAQGALLFLHVKGTRFLHLYRDGGWFGLLEVGFIPQDVCEIRLFDRIFLVGNAGSAVRGYQLCNAPVSVVSAFAWPQVPAYDGRSAVFPSGRLVTRDPKRKATLLLYSLHSQSKAAQQLPCPVDTWRVFAATPRGCVLVESPGETGGNTCLLALR